MGMALHSFHLYSEIHPFQFLNSDTEYPISNCNGISVLSTNKVQPSILVSGSVEGEICLTDLNNLKTIQNLCGHKNAISDISFLRSDPCLVLSSSRDGTVSVFDSRLHSRESRVVEIKLSLSTEEAEVWSADVGGDSERLLACTSSEQILIYDIRVLSNGDRIGGTSTKQKRKKRSDGLVWMYTDMHTDLVNYVRFHPYRRSLLTSGADDDLICVYDTQKCSMANSDTLNRMHSFSNNSSKNDTDSEDSGFDDPSYVGSINAESAPRLIKFIGPNKTSLCIVSTTETVQVWSVPVFLSGKRESDAANAQAGEHDAASSVSSNSPSICSNSDFNSSMNDYFSCNRLIDPTSNIRLAPQLACGESGGYIVDVIYDELSEQIFVLGGSSEGSLFLYEINKTGMNVVAPFLKNTKNTNCHSSVVRCSDTIWSDSTLVIVSGAEDGSLCIWNR